MTLVSTWKLTPAGDYERVVFVPQPESLNEASGLIPAGVYTTLRTFRGNRILPLIDHINRLEVSAWLIDRPIQINPSNLKAALSDAVNTLRLDESRIRITADLQQNPGDVYISVEPLQVPTEKEYAEGVRANVYRMQRENPLSKQTSFIWQAEAIRAHLPPDANEGLLVGEKDCILEGLSSNFFAILGDMIWTAGEGILMGITRAMVLEAAALEGIPVIIKAVTLDDVHDLQEAFITSSSRSVLPVRQIDETSIGGGVPGPITRQIMAAYRRLVDSRLEHL